SYLRVIAYRANRSASDAIEASDKTAEADPSRGRLQSGIRESNPSHSLGKAGHSRYTNPATPTTIAAGRAACNRRRRDFAMTPEQTLELLRQVRDGALAAEDAARRLQPAVADLGFATVDLERRERCGFPEVVFAQGKTCEWLE